VPVTDVENEADDVLLMPELIGGLEGGCEDDSVGQRLTSGVAERQEQAILGEGPGRIVLAENLTQPDFVYRPNSGVERDRSEALGGGGAPRPRSRECGARTVGPRQARNGPPPVTPAG